ncbi:MAG: zinc ribbon domain-containing protein [Candidatus Lokiarchaeota archaeon]|nr:zinc ribbon domain-containing protein [Candidatus Lokiarchaeota archaeon]
MLTLFFFLISYLNRVRYKKNPENINKYFEIRKDGIVILKDLESNSEIKRINLLSIEKKIADVLPRKSYEFCPNCGSQIKTYTGFCQSCGKNLKL